MDGGRSSVDNGIACVASQDCRQGKALVATSHVFMLSAYGMYDMDMYTNMYCTVVFKDTHA